MGEVDKIGGRGGRGGVFFTKWYHLFSYQPFQCYLSLSVVCVCVFIHIISIGVLCVSREELSLIESNQQIYMWLLQANNFWKTKTLWDFERVIFHSSKLLIQCNTNFCCAYITGVVNTYLYLYIFTRVSLLIPVCCAFVCVWYQRVLVNNHFLSDFSKIDVMLHKTHSKHTMVPRPRTGISIISLSRITSNVVWSPIQPKTKANKKSSGGGAWGET